jgi:Putative transposase
MRCTRWASTPARSMSVAAKALNLNVHFHCVIPDGVFVREDGSVRFVELGPPSDDGVMAVLSRVVGRPRQHHGSGREQTLVSPR